MDLGNLESIFPGGVGAWAGGVEIRPTSGPFNLDFWCGNYTKPTSYYVKYIQKLY